MSNNGAADLVVKSAKIYTVEINKPWAQAVAVRGDKITAVGTDEDMKQLIEDTTQLIDAKNRLVLPGFIDSHVHFNLGAITLDEISLNTATSIDEVQPRIKDYVASSHITYLVCNVKK